MDSYRQLVWRCPDWTLYHTPEWLAYLDTFAHGTSEVLGIHCDGELVGLLPGRIVKAGPVRLFVSPMRGWTTQYMGPIWLRRLPPDVFQSAFTRYMRQARIHHAEFVCHDYALVPMDGWTTEMETTYIAPLASEPEALLADFGKSCRKGIRRAQRSGVDCQFTDDERFVDVYYSQLQEVFAKHSMRPTYSIERVRALWRHLKPCGRLLASWATIEGRVVATRMDLLGNKILRSFGSASSQADLRHYPNEALRYFVMSWAGQHGFASFDMTGGGTYKRKFNARECPIVRWMRSNPFLRMARVVAKEYYRLSNLRFGLRRGKAAEDTPDSEEP